MDNQHRKISGYRELSEAEVALMNEIKAHAETTANLIEKVSTLRNQMQGELAPPLMPDQFNESKRCLSLAKTQLQQGQMWFVRAVALPNSF